MSLVVVGCTGVIDDSTKTGAAYDDATGEADDDGEGGSGNDGRSNPLDDDGVSSDGDDASSNDGGEGADGDGGGEPVDTSAFTYATLGSRCSDGSRKSFVVVSRAEGSCESHARALDEPSTDDVLRIVLDDDDVFDGSVPLCSGGSCRDIPVHLSLTGRGDGASGTLELEVDGAPVTRSVELSTCDYDTALPPPRDALAGDVNIREVALYQGVKVQLATNGTALDQRNAPVVAGRPALVRAFVDPLAGFTSRALVGRLELSTGDGEPRVLESRLTVSGSSNDRDLATTFNFDVPAELVTGSTQYAISVQEAESCGSSSAPAGASRVPATGSTTLGAETAGPAFRVVVVPVRYTADGSSRTPPVDNGSIAGLRDALFRMFPVSDVQVSVRAPMNWDVPVQANGAGWSELLDQCLTQRDADNVDPGVYYYCMFNPAPSFGDYCGGGCVAGLGPVPFAGDVQRRGSIGLGFGDAAGTMAHELGHALGRPHAPCGGAAGPDPGFPYSGGRIGSWGYDLTSKALLAPDEHTDFMGYCGNAWISDYNFELLFDRMRAVYTAPRLLGPPRELLSIIVDADGSLKLGHHLELSNIPQGELVRARFFDAEGNELFASEASFVPVTHVSGGIVYVPEPPAGAVRVDLEGFGSLVL